ncbi:MAG: hypothetical protein P8182_05645 [Deltaproteobacteria bacterium]
MRVTDAVINRWAGYLLFTMVSCLVLAMSASQTGYADERGFSESTVRGREVAAQPASLPGTYMVAQQTPKKEPVTPGRTMTTEERVRAIEQMLQKVKKTGERAEIRSYQNKMMGRELVRLVRAAVVVLVVIAAGFPVIIWLLSRKRILGLSSLSSEVAATLVVVEERQAKLANILKDLQGEIDYVHSMSVPDLKKLIDQAEKYIEQNKKDLDRAGVPRQTEQDSGDGPGAKSR